MIEQDTENILETLTVNKYRILTKNMTLNYFSITYVHLYWCDRDIINAKIEYINDTLFQKWIIGPFIFPFPRSNIYQHCNPLNTWLRLTDLMEIYSHWPEHTTSRISGKGRKITGKDNIRNFQWTKPNIEVEYFILQST